MENATKALIMAAGMLIGIIILTLFIYELNYVGNIGNDYYEQLSDTEILEFNAQFEKFENTTLTAQNVITICNYIIKDWNVNNESDQIEIEYNNATLKYAIKKAMDNNDTAEFLDTYWKESFSFEVTGYSNTTRKVNSVKITINY